MNKKTPNIFWFIIDSVRPYRSGLDDRDRIDIMDEFAADSVEFTKCFTSAPSSLLAAGSLFTGLPSVFVARHFNDWKFINPGISTIRTLVEEYGYQSIPLIDGRNAREKYQEFLPPFPSKYLPKGFHLSDYTWTNEEVTKIFENIITNHVQEPCVFTFWYDCRRDPLTSKHVKDAIELIKSHGMYDDSIIIMNSDHGYPDPSTKLDVSFFKNLGHDMILTDDNIQTPLIIKYPGCPTGLKVDNVVGHPDILPTIFDLLKINLIKENDAFPFRGKSLLNIINGEDDSRIIRTDTRLRMDKDRITSYRSSDYKYIKFHDDNIAMLFDLNKDPRELDDISNKNDEIINKVMMNFKSLDIEYDQQLLNLQHLTLKSNFSKLKKKFENLTKDSTILLITPAPIDMIDMLFNILNENYGVKKISVMPTGNFIIESSSHFHVINDRQLLKSYDYLIYLTHNSRGVYLKSQIVSDVKTIKSKNKLLMNYNFESFDYFSLKSFPSYIRLFFQLDRKGYFYKQEPRYFLSDLLFYIKYSFKYFIKVKNRQKMEDAGDIMTAREIIAYRNHHLQAARKGVGGMSDSQFEYEEGRIKDWGKE